MAAVAENSDSDSSDDCAFLPYEIANGSILPYQFEPEVDVGVVEVTLATRRWRHGHSRHWDSMTQGAWETPRGVDGHCDILTLSVVKEHRCCREIPVVRTRIMNGQDKGKQS